MLLWWFLVIPPVLAGEEHRWAEAAWRWLLRDCAHCVGHKAQARLYLAPPTSAGLLRAVSADGGARQSGLHDAVLLIDPKPHLRFGHPLYMFFVDLNSSRPLCEAQFGVLLEGGACLSQWERPRCHRRVPARRGAGCALLFPPEVRAPGPGGDLLRCSAVWGPCPPARRPGGLALCDPLATNTNACHHTLTSPCIFMRTCHHAVLISGGWNKQMADEESFRNIRIMNNMLKKNGFASTNIKIFFGNGLNQNEKDLYSEEIDSVYPSSLKFALRYHLRSLCEVKQCSNTLFVYLNSPTRPDGASLLWDVSGNGELDETEVYTLKEMFRDLGGCKSRRVVIVYDQAFSSEVIRGLNRYASSFRNTVLFAAGAEEPRDSTARLLGGLAPWQCLSSLGPSWAGPGVSNTTLAGTECDSSGSVEDPPACQNLSTLEMLEAEQVI